MKNKAKQLITLSLAALLTVTSFAACTGTSSSDTPSDTSDTGSNTPKDAIVISADYVVIYEQDLAKQANKIRSEIYSACGKTPTGKVASDASEESAYEVLIGDTGRIESTDFISSLGDNEYGVKIIEANDSVKIVIAAKVSGATSYATSLFLSDYMSGEKNNATLKTKQTIIKKYDPKDIESDTTVFGGIEFEEKIIKVTNTGGVPYTRMTKLQDGRLMMVYTQSNTAYAIYSSDLGLTWSAPVAITSNIDQDDIDGKKLLIANAMAYQIADGTILVAYRANEEINRTDGPASIQKTGKYHSSIRIMASTDGGKSFQRHSIVWDLYEENIQKWYASCGLWEPHLGMLNGELACFFAIGKSVYEYNHPINSTDIFVYRNNQWVRAEYSSNETPGSVKNGMPVWQEVLEGGYVMAVESNQNNKGLYANVLTAKLFTSLDGKYWTNQCDVYIPKKSYSKSGAPYVVQLPNGQIVVSYMTNDDQKKIDRDLKGDSDCIFKISISKPGISVFDLKGEDDFEGAFNVLEIPVGKFATYGGMYVDDTYLYVYCATNSGGNQILLRRAPLAQLEKGE